MLVGVGLHSSLRIAPFRLRGPVLRDSKLSKMRPCLHCALVSLCVHDAQSKHCCVGRSAKRSLDLAFKFEEVVLTNIDLLSL